MKTKPKVNSKPDWHFKCCCYKYIEKRGRVFEKETEKQSRGLFLLELSSSSFFGFKIITFHRRDQWRKMGRYCTKRMFLLLTPILLLPLLISSSSGAPDNSTKNGVSIIKEGRFPSSASEVKLPKLADLAFEDLNVCKVFNGKTCSSASRMLPASKAVESLATYGEAVKDCLDLFEGILSGTLRICASVCDRVFEACSDAYFSTDASDDEVIVPCGASESIICGKASKWESNGTAFCYALGFTVQPAEESPVVKEALIKTEHSTLFHGLQISWLVTVLVLRIMLLKRWLDQQQMRAMIQRMREER